jgi:acyl-[acyl-carrier-protein]-phospholipid O-acyltransferase/long-chain-fatty-acid--[acyl-carrier-protein] ligase
MVPHLTIEQKINETWPQTGGEGAGVIVLGVSDEKKGEALVLLTTFAIDPVELRTKLLAAGFPALWIPKVVKQIETLPLLATGKLDLRACQKLAQESKTTVATEP